MPGVPATEDTTAGSLRTLPSGGHAATIIAIAPATVLRLRDELIAVAAQAFGAAPWNERPADAVRVVDRMFCSLGRRDFIAVAALDGPDLAGFAYGHTDTLCAALHPRPAAPVEAFEVVELAVATGYQGRGVGKALHDALLVQAPGLRLLLTHHQAPAFRTYQRWGWTDLGAVTAPSGRELRLMRHDAPEPAASAGCAPA